MKRVHCHGLVLLVAMAIISFTDVAHARANIDPLAMNVRFDNTYVLSGEEKERYLEILITARDKDVFTGTKTRVPMNLALVIDRSGSMNSQGKMRFAQEAAEAIVDKLRHDDQFALIGYNSSAAILIAMQPPENRQSITRMIYSLTPDGGTNLGAGLQEGYRQMYRHRTYQNINRVILLSDGLANEGIISEYELARIAGAEAREGVSLSTMGVGESFNEDMMTSLAEHGGGNYYYIDHPERIPEILAREFVSAENLVASNITLHIELIPSVRVRKMMGYQHQKTDNEIVLKVGDIATGERRRFMALIDTPSLPPGNHRIGKAWITYKIVGDARETAITEELHLQSTLDSNSVDSHQNSEVMERSLVFEANDARKKAALAFDKGGRSEAKKILSETKSLIEHAAMDSGRIKTELRQIEQYADAMDQKMSIDEKARMQKMIKYKSHELCGD